MDPDLRCFIYERFHEICAFGSSKELTSLFYDSKIHCFTTDFFFVSLVTCINRYLLI